MNSKLLPTTSHGNHLELQQRAQTSENLEKTLWLRVEPKQSCRYLSECYLHGDSSGDNLADATWSC